MNVHNSIIDTIGDTPMVRLGKIGSDLPGDVLVKVEYFNPGNSMKDRMAVKMIEDAEKAGEIKPGGTIIEGTSGNTGMGLALAAIAKGYKCIFTLADKQSQEKIDILRAVGAEVFVCPTSVDADDPRSYYSVAQQLHRDTPNSIYPNQYDNLSNSKAHYETTGPEIWRDTDGSITHYAAGVGTGGSMCGVSKYLKEQNSDIVTVGIDTYGSVFKKYKETGIFDESEIYPYMTEGIGEDILPKNVDFDLIDYFVKVTDKDAAIMTRRLAREEGLFCGWSCGSAVAGALDWAGEHMKKGDVMVVILPDHGTRYLGKVYNDSWMKDHGFLEERDYATARDIIGSFDRDRSMLHVDVATTVSEAVHLLTQANVSQAPVTDNGSFVGSLIDSKLLGMIIDDPSVKETRVSEVMGNPFQIVPKDTTLDVLASIINRDNPAVLVPDGTDSMRIITQHDVLKAVTEA